MCFCHPTLTVIPLLQLRFCLACDKQKLEKDITMTGRISGINYRISLIIRQSCLPSKTISKI